MIVDDAMTVINGNGTPLLLTKRIGHAKALADALRERDCDHVILLYGAEAKKARHDKLDQLKHIPAEESLAVVATGSYIGEGFDCKRLDTLILTAPVSAETAITQYLGRLHRDNDGKREVRVYDYIDVAIPMASSMYRKRLKTYVAQGYTPMMPDSNADSIRRAKMKALSARKSALAGADAPIEHHEGDEPIPVINADRFHTAFRNDIKRCQRRMTICAGYLTRHAIDQLADVILETAGRGVTIAVSVRISPKTTEASRLRAAHNMDRLRALGCTVQVVEACNEFAVFDDELIWFGTIDLLGTPKPDDRSLRFANTEIAGMLIASTGKNEGKGRAQGGDLHAIHQL
ncbi:RNA helicase [Bifidobacterium sp. MA2]|uniref:RNA helicase n=1 Tax=Bifidobacterium santillanense TaxID=2809028 RepID=A0ABS5UM86_9BIFI|nr:RNA helicase [Bifidobacterium santillanense]MBT1171962.1 RNA helicase [Bifidobacterium santillanense]